MRVLKLSHIHFVLDRDFRLVQFFANEDFNAVSQNFNLLPFLYFSPVRI